MVVDLVAKEALDFRLPLAEIARRPSLPVLRRKRTLDAEAQRQRIVMLVRERDESRVALHERSALARWFDFGAFPRAMISFVVSELY